ncbi:MAG TPA: D-alanine--D-alanine ligase [Chitinophagaceae bacterium]|nr:D-alanine--D-alanine ligase [Chitinophagaceae bacterium]HMZ45725.1 D-alanine--D-alanine ligase [Chitinophagaceae bacterium]HNJ57553.1 D-alanine--D-alanine ligase [Chitinophagaceae bacterium]HNL82468.1 D-alanine--D-alanine ligase [Chitinophagaceae bacterium]HNM35273.1 D-alanine--D-alanine ligase [Chitinophagaceae bacterium]
MKKCIAIVTGGYSKEAEISYKSVITVTNNIDKQKFDWYIIDINPEGWWYLNDANEKIFVNKNNFTIDVNNTTITLDAVLMCMHGTPGEDGKLQGYFDMIGLPYTSCNAAVSALTFNKKFTVSVAANSGINVAKSIMLFKNNSINEKEIAQQLKFPVFVKPNNGGSSIGMSKVYETSNLSAAISKAFEEDDQILIEEFIAGRELTIGVFKTKGEIITLPITEIITKNDYFDYKAKYLGESDEITPANVEETIAEKIRNAAKKAYQVFNCNGIVRIDFIFESKLQQPFMLEINTVPGQSAESIVPQQVKAMGWSLQDFYTALIEECFTK